LVKIIINDYAGFVNNEIKNFAPDFNCK